MLLNENRNRLPLTDTAPNSVRPGKVGDMVMVVSGSPPVGDAIIHICTVGAEAVGSPPLAVGAVWITNGVA